MSIQKSEAILLRKQDLRETSLILTFYTKDFGKVKGVMKGVRGPHATHGGRFEIFAHDQIVFYDRKRGDLCTISGCDLLEFFASVRQSLGPLGYATYIIELLDSVTTLGDSHGDVFDLAITSLRLLAGDADPRAVAQIFEIKLLSLLGLEPALEQCAHCGHSLGDKALFSFRHGGLICEACRNVDTQAQRLLPDTLKLVEFIRSAELEDAAKIKAAPEVAKELGWVLRKFIDYHIDHRLKSIEFIKELDSA